MNFETVMQELEKLGKERLKKIYMSNGACEPLFGVATGEMKPLSKKIGINQELAEQLYATNNYDAMYFAGIIADPDGMSEDDYERWINQAYFFMISDFIVAVTLSESNIAFKVADKWISSGVDLKMSAGYSCYCWMLGNRKDSEFSLYRIEELLEIVRTTIKTVPERSKASMANFVLTVGISYIPLHDKALQVAKEIGEIKVKRDKKPPMILNPYEDIVDGVNKGRLGFKRRYVRC